MGKRTGVYNEKSECCGCTACKSICPKNAISMKADKEGFLYPEINRDLCIDCDLCEKVCSFNDKYDKKNLLDNQLVYAVKHINEQERSTSQSGGAFAALADYILSINGVVYGVGYDKDYRVIYKTVKNKNRLMELKGSKYVQSDLNDIFKEIKNNIKNNITVFFTGTPCVVAGLKSYLGNLSNNKNLYLCDIICHGTPSPLIWEEYLNFIKKRYGTNITKVNFRDKDCGWSVCKESFQINDKKIILPYWGELFGSNLMLRPSCEKCYFANFDRPSDITIGDFWGIDKTIPEMNDDKGVSLVIINTENGKKIFGNIANKLYCKESNKANAIQHNLVEPTPIPKTRIKFWNDYKQYGFDYILKKYSQYGLKYRLIKNSKSIIKSIIRYR